MLPALFEFLARLGDHWLWLMGLLLMVEPLIDYYWRDFRVWADKWLSRSLRTRIAISISVLAVFTACFLAFRDEYKTAINATAAQQRAEGERDEARLQRDRNVSPTINRLSGDLEAARGQIEDQRGKIIEQGKKLAAEAAEIDKLRPKPPRILSETDKARLYRVFLPLKSQFPSLQISAPGESEPQNYARQLKDIFNSIGIKVERVGFIIPTSIGEVPLSIVVKDTRHAPDKAVRFFNAMQQAGFSVTGGTMDSLGPEQFLLVVGKQ